MESWKARVYASYRDLTPGGPTLSDAGRAVERRVYLRRYARFLPRDKAAPILDIGCGAGGFLEAVQSAGHACIEGVDVSPAQVQAARTRGVSAVVTEAPALDYLRQQPARYALITAFSVLEHQTRPQLFELLDAIRDALTPGGLLIAVVPNAKGLFGAHVRFADITHELSFTPTSVVQICSVSGLTPIAILEHGPVVHGVASAIRWIGWQAIRASLLAARIVEGADWRWPVFTQDLVFVALNRPSSTRSETCSGPTRRYAT
jgi:SAM-dependent methyltransferase